MDCVNTAQLQDMLIAASQAIVESEPLLTRIDQLTGDGDHGTGMMLGFGAVRKKLQETPAFDSPVALLKEVGTVLIDTMGGASGVLFGTLFISGARQLEAKDAMTSVDFASFLGGGANAIRRRGRAEPGDKTMLDALIPAAEGLRAAAEAGESVESSLLRAAALARAGAEATKGMRARAGRAKAYAEASVGHPDAGATSSAILLSALADRAQALVAARPAGPRADAPISARERVRRAVHFQRPDRVPILMYNRDFEQSDLIVIEVARHWMGENRDTSEWGFAWERRDGTMGQPRQPLLPSWDDWGRLAVPDPLDASRFEGVPRIMRQYGEKYYVASLALTGFTIMTFLRGFANTLEDLYLDRERIDRLADAVFGFEEGIIGQLKGNGFDAVAFFDDWGTQTGLIISPALWREMFLPRYRRQFELAHRLGLDVYFHSCGQIGEIIPDLIEIGVDILNLSQPNIFDVKALGAAYRGRVCFLCPVSYQTTSLTGGREEIRRDVASLIQNLGTLTGGIIGYVEEYRSIGLTDENYWHCVNAFRELGTYPETGP